MKNRIEDTTNDTNSGLTPVYLSIVNNILKQYIPDISVCIFGSRAKGTFKNTSDLDLCLFTDTQLDFRVLSDLKDAFVASDLPFRVDLVEYRSLPTALQKSVDKIGVRI